MSGRLAVDFGTSNTVLAMWTEARHEGLPLHIPEYCRFYRQGSERISLIPSLIHYAADGRQLIGNQVLNSNLYESNRTFRWMKRYIVARNPGKVSLGGRDVSHFDAGREFLSAVLGRTAAQVNVEAEEVTFTLPVEAFEHYEDWLADAAYAAGMPRFRFIDEPSAAALGCGTRIRDGDVHLVFDFGGGTLDTAVVLMEESSRTRAGRYCRVLGKAAADVGGAKIDQWLFQEVLKRNGRSDTDEDVRRISRELLVECERAKERLSYRERAQVSAMIPDTGAVLSAEFTRDALENLLEERGLFATVSRVILRAINDAHERGYSADDVKAVLMVGGSSLIPCIQRTVQRIFGRHRVMLDHPLDAVARGAAAFVAGVDLYDYIQHDYAIRHVDRRTGSCRYRVVVNRGTPYPTSRPVETVRVRPSFDGQTRLGLAVFEIREQYSPKTHQMDKELVLDPSGAARLVEVTPDEEGRREYFWMNEQTPTFLVADPPAKEGEPRFEVAFSVDGNKRLLIAARDLKTGRTTHRDYPVVKLT